MTDYLNKEDSPHLFRNVLSAIKILAGSSFKLNVPFIYSDGDKDIAALVTDDEITLLAPEEETKEPWDDPEEYIQNYM